MKVKINRQQLVRPEMNTLNVMLGTLNLVSASLALNINGEDAVADDRICILSFGSSI